MEDVLEKVDKVSDEIILVDSHSTDRTIEVAEKFDAEIFQHDFKGYRDERNFGAEKSTYQWILSIDTDEIISEELVEEINTKKEEGFERDGYEIVRDNFVFGEKVSHWSGPTVKLYNREKGSFEGSEIHESVKVEGEIGRLDGRIEHYTYDSVEEYLSKIEYYTRVEAKDIENVGWKQLYINPLEVFISKSLQGLILDGRKGVFICIMSAVYEYLKYFRAVEDED